MTALVLSIYWKIMQTVLLVPGTLTDMAAKPALTHYFCNHHAAAILRNRQEYTCADFLSTYVEPLNAGSSWADSSCKNASHFFNPCTYRGKWYLPHALWEFKGHYDKACKFARQKDYLKAAFFLGAAGHLVQDLCVPHHSMSILFDGHKSFENWAQKNRTLFGINSGATPQLGSSPYHWVLFNAEQSQKYYPLVSENSSEKDFFKAASALLPLAQRTSAGFYYQFVARNI